MKKIEKTEELELPNISGRPYHHLGYGDKRGRWLEMATIAEKVNEIIINQNLIIDRLNQEVSQPEMKSVCDKHHLEICDECMKNGSWTFIQPQKEVENNTEEKNRPEILKDIVHRIIRDNDLELATEEIVDLISERSFNKEEALLVADMCHRSKMEYCLEDEEWVRYLKAEDKIRKMAGLKRDEEFDRLLSLEKEK